MNSKKGIEYWIVPIIIFFGLLTLGGCKTVPLTSSALSNKTILLDQVNDTAKDDPAWFTSFEQERKNIGAKYTGELNPGMAIYLENDIYIYDDKKVDVYLLAITDRLLQGWIGDKPELTAVVETGKFFNAYVDELNQLHVSTGLLRELDNEDQLAAVLAHELSHVLLRHNSEKSIIERTDSALDMGGMLAVAGGTIVDKTLDVKKYQVKGLDGQLGFQSLGLVWSDLLAPKWSRDNEREADMMGLDLLIRANYNYEEFFTVIEKIHDADVARSKRLEIFRNVAYATIEKHQKKINTSAGEKWDKVLEGMRADLENLFVEQTADTLTSMKKDHDDRDERIDLLKTYLQQAHGGGELPPEISKKTFSSIVKNSKSRARLKQDLAAIETINALRDNKMDLALKNSASLRINSSNTPISTVIAKSSVEMSKRRYSDAGKKINHLLQNKNSPAEAYIKLANLHMAKRKYIQAEKALNLGIERIGRDYKFLPTLVSLNKVSGNISAAEENTIRCKKYDDEIETFLSKFEFGGASGDSTYYQECVNALGYDVIAKRQKKEKKSATTILQGALDNLFQ